MLFIDIECHFFPYFVGARTKKKMLGESEQIGGLIVAKFMLIRRGVIETIAELLRYLGEIPNQVVIGQFMIVERGGNFVSTV